MTDHEEDITTATAISTVITPDMNRLLNELKNQLTLVVEHEFKSSELLVKIYEQGRADGLSNNKIRELVVSVLRDVKHLGDRQIRRLLPEELKRKYNFNQSSTQDTDEEPDSNSDIMSELPNTFRAIFAGLNININPEYERINRSSEHQNINEQYDEFLRSRIQSTGPQTIIINEYGTIIDGHKTFRICNELGINPKYEIREFEDEYEEQEFIIHTHLNPNLREWQKAALLIKFDNIIKSAILEWHPRCLDEYLGMGIWIGNALVAVEIRNPLKDTLCFLCEVDGKEDYFVEPRMRGNRAERDDQFSAHILKRIQSNGWSKYLPHLMKHERYIDPKTHQWKFKDTPDADADTETEE
jgi:hypothetical protein